MGSLVMRQSKMWGLILLVWGSLTLSAANFKGPFQADALAFYFVHDGGPLKLSLQVEVAGYNHRNPQYLQRDGAFVGRIFDVDEKLKVWEYRKVKRGTLETVSYDFGQNAPAGIYQIRYSGSNIKVQPSSIPEKQFGISAMRCMMAPMSHDQFAETWFRIPRTADELTVISYGGKPILKDATGTCVSKMKKLNVAKSRGEIWQFQNLNRNLFGFDGIAPILCPDKETAAKVGDSLETASDGTLYAHKFQVRIHDWIEKTRKMDLTFQTVDLQQFVPEMKKDPAALGLVGSRGILNYLNDMLTKQNLNPGSRDFGKSPYPQALAFACGVNKPYNPYYQNPVIEKRMLLNALQRFLQITENDTFWLNCNNYCGSDALVLVKESSLFMFTEAYQAVKDPVAKELWFDAVRRIPDRFSMFRVTCENQSCHWPVIYESLYQAAGEKNYQTLARDYIHGMTPAGGEPFIRSGYLQEAYGPDATYQGLGACQLALYYRMSGNPEAKELLKTIYTLFNHTIAPEPGGGIVGSSNFSHRTPGPWTLRQYRGGVPLMKGELQEAANIDWNTPEKTVEQLFRTQKCNRAAGYSTAVFGEYYSIFKYPSRTLPKGKLPAEQDSSFFRNFNNEFVAMRKPAYYALAYTGRTAQKWVRARCPKTPEGKRNSRWHQTQGLSMLWFPGFGSFVLGMNWNGSSANILRADFDNGECAYPDYWGFEKTISPDAVRMKSAMFNLDGLSFERTLRFLEKGIAQELTIHAAKEIHVKDFYEQLPLLQNGKKQELQFFVNGKWQTEPGTASRISVSDKIMITLHPAVPCSFGAESAYQGQVVKALRFHLPTEMKANESISLSYTIELLNSN